MKPRLFTFLAGLALAVGVAHAISPIPFIGVNLGVAPYGGLGTLSVYDGTNDYGTRGADLSGIANGKQGTFSGWVAFVGGNGYQMLLAIRNGGGANYFQVFRGDAGTFDNEIYINGSNSAGADIFTIKTANSFTAGPKWWHILASWDLSDPNKRHLYINDVSDLVVTTFTNDTLDYTNGNVGVGALTDGTLKLNGGLGEVFFHTAYIDLSVEANRRKFISYSGRPVSLGANGSLPLGVQPLIYLPTGDPSNNLGTGGAFVVSGALTAATSSPFVQPQYDPIAPSHLADNGYSTTKGYYYDASSQVRFVVSTDATSANVYFMADATSYSSFSTLLDVGVWDGTTRQSIDATRPGINMGTVALAAGTKTVEIASGVTSRINGAGDVLGVHLMGVYFNGGTFATQVATTTSPRIVIYGDSISSGFSASEPPNNSWAAKLRQLYSGSVMHETWGYRSLYEDSNEAGGRQALVDRIESYSPSIIWLAVGTNDYAFNDWNAASFGTAYADFLDKLHTDIPGATIYAQSPIVRVTETANAFGNTLDDYRAQISTVCGARAWCNYVDGEAFITVGDISADTVHPTTTGHDLIYEAVATELGLTP